MRLGRWGVLVALLACAGCGSLSDRAGIRVGGDDRPHLWSIGIMVGSSPFGLHELDGAPNPRFTAVQLGSVPASFVADPFLVRRDGEFFLFFELFNTRPARSGASQSKRGRGEIGVATSKNGRDWVFNGVVLSEPFHLSYPCVFAENGVFYMVPESRAAGEVRLYRARKFPDQWEYIATLFSGPYADPTIFRHAERWWIFAEQRAYTLTLWSAASLEGPWEQHPQSPLYVNDPSRTRPAGPVVLVDGRLIRFAQDNREGYGKRVRAFEITTLDQERFAERVRQPDPLLEGGGAGWCFNGMHHLSPLKLSEQGGWLAAVDGNGDPAGREDAQVM